jgi:hypothetical protein
MARHLNSRDVSAIVEMIRGSMKSKLTWQMVCDDAASLIGQTISRQSLNSHPDIKAAYVAKRKHLRAFENRVAVPSSLAVAGMRIARGQSTINELKDRINQLFEQHVIWQYNAHKHNITEQDLNEPLPRIDRDRTDGKTSTELEQDGKAKWPRGPRGKRKSIR